MQLAAKILTLAFVGILMAASVRASSPAMEFGTLPVVQALPLFVASEKGYFSQEGLAVELVVFNSATDKDVALTSGRIAGYFGDLMTPMVLHANRVPLKIVATVFNTTGSQRMFALLVPPGSPARHPEELAKGGIATSSNTIVEYITLNLVGPQNLPGGNLDVIEVKSIPIRLQMLLSGQIPAAALPEPLVTFAETKGARVVADDAGRGISFTVLAFGERWLKDHPQGVRAFLKAVSRAAAYINSNPEEARPIMNRNCQVPDPLQKSFSIPTFPSPALPDPGHVTDVSRWLVKKGIIRADVRFEQLVADGFLP